MTWTSLSAVMGLAPTEALVFKRLQHREAITRPEFVVRGDGLPVAPFACTKKPNIRLDGSPSFRPMPDFELMAKRCKAPLGRLRARLLAMMHRRMKFGLHLALRLAGILRIVGREHRDDGYRASAVAAGPLTLDERELHGFPVLALAFKAALWLRCSGVAVV